MGGSSHDGNLTTQTRARSRRRRVPSKKIHYLFYLLFGCRGHHENNNALRALQTNAHAQASGGREAADLVMKKEKHAAML